MDILLEIQQAVAAGKRVEVKRLLETGLQSGLGAKALLEQGLITGMDLVGSRFKRNEVFVPEMLIAARAMKEALAFLEPHLIEAGIKPKYIAVLGTVQGDLHDIGKNLVGMMWKGANFDVIDLGVNVAPERFCAAVEEKRPHIVGLSALLTTTMPAMKESVAKIRAGAFGASVKIVVGGAPVTSEYADEIGADGYSPDAASAVDLARELLNA